MKKQKINIIYLDYTKARPFIVDYKDYISKYQVVKHTIDGFDFDVKQPTRLVKGAPNIICIDGTYIMVKGLLKCCKWKDKKIVLLYARSIYRPELSKKAPLVKLHWSRRDGQV